MPYVYRYKDTFDGKYKYIGIVKGDTFACLLRRIKQHRKDEWFKNSEFNVDYIEVQTICDAEAIEGSLIGKYQTWRFYNKAKRRWGESTLFQVNDNLWKLFGIESLQAMYSESIKALSNNIAKLIETKQQLEKQTSALECCMITADNFGSSCMLSAVESDLMEKINLYEDFASNCATKTIADKWAYRANRYKSAIAIIKEAVLERQRYSYSKEYREDSKIKDKKGETLKDENR